jgi:hypothetical protein
MAWITDGQQAGALDESDIHQTAEIRQFLSRSNEGQFILVASKGMGKTTLMRLKREQLQNDHSGITLIPNNNETDTVSLPSMVHNSLLRGLQDEEYWLALWQTAIMVSVIVSSNVSAEVASRQRATKKVADFALPQMIIDDLIDALQEERPARQKPSEILDSLLKFSKVDFDIFRRADMAQLTFIFRDVIASGCAVFIDSLDQELETKFPGDIEVWRFGQLGLLRAAWEINRLNNHVKVFVSVRQEAWASYKAPVKNNIVGSTIILRYSDKDLKVIFEKAIEKNDGPYSIEEFIGFRTINNIYLNRPEDVFEFLKRHTVGTPRWFVMLGSRIATIRDTRGVITDPELLAAHELEIAETVNDYSAKLAEEFLDSEMRMFFMGSEPTRQVKLLLGSVQSTVLTLPNLQRLSERYLSVNQHGMRHPFCLLLNLGLLGFAERNQTNPRPYIRFRMPYEFDWHYHDILPKGQDSLFFLHPSLHQMAQDCSSGFRFSPVRIGNRLPLEQSDLDEIKKRRIRIFVSYSSRDWEHGVRELIEEIEDQFNEWGVPIDMWVDREKMEGAQGYLKQMAEGNRRSEIMLLCASQNSMASEPVMHEIGHRMDMDFRNKQHTMFTVILDDMPIADLPMGLEGDHIIRISQSNFRVENLADQIRNKHSRIKRSDS